MTKNTAVDSAVSDVQGYMATPFWTRRKDQIQVATVATVLLAIGGYLFFLHFPPLVTDLRSHFWPETEATIVRVRVYTERRWAQSREVDTDYMDFLFQYEVKGEDFLRGRSRVPYYDTFGDKPHEVGDRITVLYNPAKPGQVVHERYVYKRSVRLVIALGLLSFGALAVGYVLSRERHLKGQSRRDD